MVFELIEGVVKLAFPVPPARIVPLVGTSYQSIVSPVFAVAEILRLPGPHLELSIPTAALGNAFIVAITGVLVMDMHPAIKFLTSA